MSRRGPVIDEVGLAAIMSQLSDAERMQCAGMLGDVGALSSALRAIAGRVWSPVAFAVDVWRWLLWLRVTRGLAAATCARYVRTLVGYADYVDSRGLDYTDVSLAQLDAWQQHLWIARRNVVGVRACSLYGVRSFYDWRKTRVGGRDCTEGFRVPRVPHRVPRKYTKPQLRKLFIASRVSRFPLVAKRNETILALLYATGLRREEVATLRLDQVDIETNVAIIRVIGKGAKEREIPVEGPVVRMLQAWMAERGQLQGVLTDALFFTVHQCWFGRQMSVRSVEKVVCMCARRAGLGEWGVHRFRVTFATQLYDDGTDIERIRILLGHENIETTRGYIAVSSRMRGVRLKAFRQHEVFGTRPEGMPLWAQHMGAPRDG